MNDKADAQDFSETGYEAAGLAQSIDISDDDRLHL